MSDQLYNGHGQRTENQKQDAIKNAIPAFDEIRKDIDTLKSDVIALTEDLKKAGSSTKQEAISYVNKNIDSWKAAGTNAVEKVEGHIKERPARSMTIAFVTGIVASYLFSRRS